MLQYCLGREILDEETYTHEYNIDKINHKEKIAQFITYSTFCLGIYNYQIKIEQITETCTLLLLYLNTNSQTVREKMIVILINYHNNNF